MSAPPPAQHASAVYPVYSARRFEQNIYKYFYCSAHEGSLISGDVEDSLEEWPISIVCPSEEVASGVEERVQQLMVPPVGPCYDSGGGLRRNDALMSSQDGGDLDFVWEGEDLIRFIAWL
ncbi:hypothetical protein AVEN_273727-1 [Araneus ventricosus]|uniref:Uncharacterized protein n=1 Tax=Araneus ventricosus TaxID=182803 RepID=A0A4Y2TNA4_ARAVE|nr:hypothetical protein AVEN_273727-1 [Araneus ventricosus]